MSEVKMNESIENEILSLFDKGIIEPVTTKLDDKELIESSKNDINEKTKSVVDAAESRISEQVKNEGEEAFSKIDGIASKLDIVKSDLMKAFEDEERSRTENKNDLLEKLEQIAASNDRMNKIKIGLISAFGTVSIVLSVVILIIK